MSALLPVWCAAVFALGFPVAAVASHSGTGQVHRIVPVASSPRPQRRPDDLRRAGAVAEADGATGIGRIFRRAGLPAATPRAGRGAGVCAAGLARAIPDRPRGARSGTEILAAVEGLRGAERDRLVADEMLAGNIPDFLRQLAPVTFLGTAADGRAVEVTLCVTPDYLACGDDDDYVRVPMGLPVAAQIAERFGFMLPTTRIVDAIYAQADVQLAPRPMPPGAQMTSTAYFARHDATVDDQGRASGLHPGQLLAGQKKDLVLSNVLRRARGRVAIYGWHRAGGNPIQPLSTVHEALYADYSHGVRLVSRTAFVNGSPTDLAALLEDPGYAAILSNEGPIPQAEVLLASLYRP